VVLVDLVDVDPVALVVLVVPADVDVDPVDLVVADVDPARIRARTCTRT
jgi:hypothetical protein